MIPQSVDCRKANTGSDQTTARWRGRYPDQALIGNGRSQVRHVRTAVGVAWNEGLRVALVRAGPVAGRCHFW